MRIFPVALLLLLAWGALAFGGSPTWAAAATLVLAVTTGIIGFLESRPSTINPAGASRSHRAVILALAIVLMSIALQLLPIPSDTLQTLSPSRDVADFEQLLATADRRVSYSPAPENDRPKPISIAGARTQLGLAGVAGLAVLLLGASRGFSAIGASGVVRAVIALGVGVAFVGLYQFTSRDRLVYGWYVPLFSDGRSAPFLNFNHQAGWLVMVMGLALGAFAGEAERGMRHVAPTWRDRILWLSSKEASVALLFLFAAAVFSVGILATNARSGALAMILSFAIVAVWNIRKQPTRGRRLTTSAGLILLAFAVLAYNGEAVLEELSETDGPGTRMGIWNDTIRIAGDFWLTGTGFNTYGAAMLHYQTLNDGLRYIEAHNDYLQLAAEGGLMVGIPFLILAVALARETWTRFRDKADDMRTYWIRVGAVVGIMGMALQSIVEFTLQMPGGAVMFTTLLAIAIHHPPPRQARGAGRP